MNNYYETETDWEAEARKAQRENHELHALVHKQANLLTGVVNALKGEPPELTLWSHHDAPELAQRAAEQIERLTAERDRMADALRADASFEELWQESERQIEQLTAENAERLAQAKQDDHQIREANGILAHERRLRGEAEAALAAEQAKVADYENRITWDTTCGNCARLLDASINDFQRREQAEAKLAAVQKIIADIDGEMPPAEQGWTHWWQAMDAVRARLRAALSTQEDSDEQET